MDPSHPSPSDHARRNRAAWTAWAEDYAEAGRLAWSQSPRWGIWGIPEQSLGFIDNVEGIDALELGCGTAYVSAWLARHGARVVGIDLSAAQLATARQLQLEFALSFPLLQCSGEQLPLRDGSFDLAISEYGVCLWCDPYRWIPEAARVLRPGGRLVFLTNAALLMLCAPDEEGRPATNALLRDYFGMHRFEWLGEDDSVEFHLPHGEWIRLLRANGFEIEALLELQAPTDAESPYPFVTADWANRWPSEEIWVARKAT